MTQQFWFGKKEIVPFRTFRWHSLSSSTEIDRIETFWCMKSNVRLQTALNFLKLLFIHGKLGTKEQQIILDHPGTLSDPVFRALATAKVQSNVSLKELVNRLENFSKLLGKPNLYREKLVPQWSGVVSLLIKEKSYPIRPKQRSSRVRNPSAVGSKKLNKITFEPIPEKFLSERFDEFEFILEALTVGEVVSRTGHLSVTLKKPLREAKR